MKYVPNIQKGKVKIHPKDDKFKIVSSKESSPVSYTHLAIQRVTKTI